LNLEARKNMEKVKNREGIKKILLFVALLGLLAAVFLSAVVIGAVQISVKHAVLILLDLLPLLDISLEEIEPVHRDILLKIRLPRVVLAGAVGISLATAGAAFQGLFRNPMADPYVIGVSSGAAVGAILAMLTGAQVVLAGFGAVPLFAFAFGFVTMLLVYYMARVGSVVPVMTLLLSGIAVSAFLSAVVSLLTFFAGEKLERVVFWLMGGLGGATWEQVVIMVPYALVGCIMIFLFHRELNALLLGEETAHHLGVDTERVKKIILAGSSLLVAAAVSTSGIIGFVGLVVPHFIRLAAGPDHRFLLPASALLGASLLIGTDTLARTVIAPTELPVGIITALVGAPLFLYLLKRRKKLRYFGGGE